MSDLVLRPSQEGDLPEITAIYGGEVLGGTASYEIEPPSVEEMTRRWRELVGGGYPYLVAERDGAVLGYAYVGPYNRRAAYRYIVEDSIYIAAQARGSGLGRALLRELIGISEGLGFRQMIAVIGGGTGQSPSVGLHSALGFRRIGLIEASGFKHGRWLDTVLMQRALGPGNTTLPDEG